MRIFISWSGAASLELARILKEWLPTVLPYANPWLSSEDIRKGKGVGFGADQSTGSYVLLPRLCCDAAGG